MLLLDIISSSGVELHQHGNEVAINCPFCVERGESADTRFRLGINVEKGLAHCYNCSFKERSTYYLAKKLCRVWHLKINLRDAMKHSSVELKPKAPPMPQEFNLPEGYENFSTNPDPIEKQAREYLKSRGISLLQIVRHKIGFAASGDYAWRILFPVMGKDHKCYGVAARDFSGKQNPRYKNSPGIKLLWGANQEARTCIVVEGVIDALHVEHAMLSKPSTIAVATLGSAMTDVQFQQLKGFEKLVLFPDFDRPGVSGVITLAKKCMVRAMYPLVVVPPVLDGRDAGDMDSEEIEQLVYDAVPWSGNAEHRLQAAMAREGML